MKRDIEAALREWKASPRRLPLILQGARQVGKTYSLKQFAAAEYENAAYFNFDENPAFDSLFQGDLDPKRILPMLSLAAGSTIRPGSTLIFFDEIQESNRALNSLKYFAEQAPEYHIVAAGSLLGVKLSGPGSFPVGKVCFLSMYPMTFYEFLSALGEEDLRQFVQRKSDLSAIPDLFHARLVDFLKQYMITGGMPACVAAFVETRSGAESRRVQRALLDSYVLDFAKHVPGVEIPKVTAIWKSLPAQLARENKKFLYRLVREGARARSYEDALQWLEDSGLVHRVRQVTAARIPLSSYALTKAFKTYLLDVGLLGALAGLQPEVLIEGSRLFTEFLGAFTENYVSQELRSLFGAPLHYWSSDGEAEIDFLLEGASGVVPLEVKAGTTLRSNSLRSFAEKTGASRLARTSLKNFDSSGNMVNVPLYAVSNVQRLLQE